MPVVKVRDHRVPRRKKIDVVRALHCSTGLDINIWRTKVGWALGLDNAVVHILMNPNVRANLGTLGLEVQKTPQYRAECTLICFNVTGDLGMKPVDEIAQEIEFYNYVKVTFVKWRCSQSIWIELDSPEEAKLLFDDSKGISLANGETLTHLSRKKFVKVPQCVRCFSFEHELIDCQKREQYCFSCGKVGHVGDNCLETTFSCINCRGVHVAIASVCPARMKKMEELEGVGESPKETLGECGAHEEEERDPEEEEEESTLFTEAEVRLILETGGLCDPEDVENHRDCTEEKHEVATHAELVALKRAAASVPDALRGARAVTGSPPSREGCAPSPSRTPPGRGVRSPPRHVPDPLPVSPIRETDATARPPSRLEDPLPVPLLRPVPVSPRRAAEPLPSRPSDAPPPPSEPRAPGAGSPGAMGPCRSPEGSPGRRSKFRRLAAQFSGLMDDVAELPEATGEGRGERL